MNLEDRSQKAQRKCGMQIAECGINIGDNCARVSR